MGYALQRHEQVTHALRRLATEQADGALADLDAATGDDLGPAVHSCRKRCKKARAVARLGRPGLKGRGYRRANDAFRDAASQLGDLRDDQALLDTFDAVVAPEAEARSVDLRAVHDALRRRADDAATRLADGSEAVERARRLLLDGREAVAAWDLRHPGDDLLLAGLSTTYRRGRRRASDLRSNRSPEVLHDWRKRAKYTWYHLRILVPASPPLLEPLTARFGDLGSALGTIHDLDVLSARLRADPAAYGGAASTAALEVVAARRDVLVDRCVRAGAGLYAEPTATLARRIGAYLVLWRDEGDDPDLAG